MVFFKLPEDEGQALNCNIKATWKENSKFLRNLDDKWQTTHRNHNLLLAHFLDRFQVRQVKTKVSKAIIFGSEILIMFENK